MPDLIAWVGAATALFAATIAVAQSDIKKVLAYSTVSQLGYMFLAVGVGRLRGRHLPHGHPRLLQGAALPRRRLGHPRHARRAGHAPHGRLRKSCRSPSATFIVGWLAIAGVPPFAGFWSKDEILLYAWDNSPALWAVGLVTALLTAFYMSRQVFLVFFGDGPLATSAERTAETRRSAPTGAPARVAWTMSAAAGGAGRPARSSAAALNLPFTTTSSFLEQLARSRCVERARGRARRGHRRPRSRWRVHRRRRRPRRHRRRRRRLPGRSRVKPVEPEVLARAWYVDEASRASWAGPAEAAAEGAADVFDRRSSTAP